MSDTRMRTRLAAAVLPLALLSLGGCQDEPASDSSAENASSGDEGQSGQSAESGESGEAGGAGDPAEGEKISPQEFQGIVAAGLEEPTTAHLTLESTGGAAEFRGEGDIDYTTKPPSSTMTMSVASLGSRDVEVRVVGGTIYTKIPGASGGKFIAFDLDDPRNPLGQDFSTQVNPQQQLDVLTKGVDRVVFVGDEEVGGEELAHYRLTVDTRKISGELGLGGDSAASGLPKKLTYDVWFDDQQRMRRMVMELGGAAGRVETRIDDYGEDVDIQKPPPGQVMRVPARATG